MAQDPHYIPAFSIEDVLLDKDTGAPLSGGLVYFEQDNQRGVLKPVYQITGSSPNYTYVQLPNPMTLSSIGTFQDALDNPVIPYFFPFDENLDHITMSELQALKMCLNLLGKHNLILRPQVLQILPALMRMLYPIHSLLKYYLILLPLRTSITLMQLA